MNLEDAIDLAFRVDEPAPRPRTAYWDELPSPIGPLMVATGEDRRVRRISFRLGRESFVDDLLARGWLPLRDREANDALERQLEEYFDRARTGFELEVDLSTVTPFTRSVLEAAARVPRGGWSTYSGIAAAIGRPAAARAVGNALGDNPIPIVIPCHRILAAGGRIGGYASGLPDGLQIKRTLLALEGVPPPR
ncbi:MAG TPA: methylated-DNA--[protein]-cysteine S-methyltransferase [Chloroflexota bacterium]|jgi:methylated-DNA-[protein]-cysteine S-methyltransferase|nr:methylated-DNA--[protein]-cysteine S-methyltransferase [Chloroflexota bacterium]